MPYWFIIHICLGFFFRFGGNLTSRWYLHSPPSGKEGWLKAGVVGGYTMLIITDLRIHLPPPPTGTPPSRRRRMENTIDYQIIIFLIKFTTKFEEEPVFIDLTLMPSLIVYIPLFIRVAAMRVTTRSSLRVNSYLQTVFSGEFPIHLLLKAYGIKTWSNKEAERFTFISLFVNLR